MTLSEHLAGNHRPMTYCVDVAAKHVAVRIGDVVFPRKMSNKWRGMPSRLTWRSTSRPKNSVRIRTWEAAVEERSKAAAPLPIVTMPAGTSPRAIMPTNRKAMTRKSLAFFSLSEF
jgi:predicted dienelactone hydrolase